MPNVFTWPSTPPATIVKMITGDDSLVNLYDATDWFFSSHFSSLDEWYQSTANSATIVMIHSGVTMHCAALADSEAWMVKAPEYWTPDPSWSDNRKFKIAVDITHNANVDSLIEVLSGFPGADRHVGFKIENGIAKGSVGDNSDETLTSESKTLGTGTFGGTWTFEVVYTVSKCEFYIDGVLLGTLTAGLPTGTTDAKKTMYFRVNNQSNPFTMDVRFSQFKFSLAR